MPVLDWRVYGHDRARFCHELRQACQHVGFFVLVGLPERLVARNRALPSLASAFFALPAAQKLEIDYTRSPQFRGYMSLGVENTRGLRDEREQVEFGAEERALAPGEEAPGALYDRLRGPNQWPGEPCEFREVFSAWLEEMENLSRGITHALSVSLGLEEEALDHLFAAPHLQAKIIRYPPSVGGADAARDSGLGVGPHSDSGFLTLLLQDDVGGLEVLDDSSGAWIQVQPLEDTLVCNLGEVLEIMTGGLYRSTLHRVVRLPPGRERISAPYFWNPSLNCMLEPLVLPNNGAVVASTPGTLLGGETSSGDRVGADRNQLLASYGMNALKSLARSHPAAFQRHHPDLRCRPDGLVERRP